jgi:hypothetical protein
MKRVKPTYTARFTLQATSCADMVILNDIMTLLGTVCYVSGARAKPGVLVSHRLATVGQRHAAICSCGVNPIASLLYVNCIGMQFTSTNYLRLCHLVVPQTNTAFCALVTCILCAMVTCILCAMVL